MKLALIILPIFVTVSHQQFFGRPPLMFGFPWFVIPFSNQPTFHNVYHTELENAVTGPYEEESFPDAHSRIKGFNPIRPSFSSENQQTGKFFYNLGNNGNKLFSIYNPFVKTATFTLTVTTISSVVTCVPSFQFQGLGVNPAVAVCVGRKKRGLGDEDSDEVDQFPIDASETQKLTPTAVPSLDEINSREYRRPDLLIDPETNYRSLISSRYDVDQGSTEDRHSRERRFVFVNKNKFEFYSTTITTYEFVPTVLTKTINLVNPPPSAQCGRTTCADCIPPGYIICPPPS